MSVKKKVLCIVIAIVVVFSLAVAAGFGFAWYQNNHIFVEGEAYPIHAESLDLRGEDISFDHYDTVHTQLPYCEILWDVPFQNGKYSSDTQTISVTSLTAEDVEILLNYFPDLTALNAVGCHDYEMLEIFQTQRTDCQVTYEVDLGGKAVANDIGELTLEVGEYDYETLITNLQFLPQLQSLTLRMPELSLEQVEQLKQTYSEMAVSCTVELLGQEYDTETTQLDLSALTSADVEAAAEKLAMLPGLTTVELADAQGASQLTMEEAKLLMDAAPQASFHYVFDFYGETVSTTDEDSTYYFQEDGPMVTGAATIQEEQYLFSDQGVMHTGWLDTEEGRRYYRADGPMVLDCWQEIEEKLYFFDEEGLMQTGWHQEGEYMYYLQDDGSAAIGPVEIDGETHYFTPQGIEVILVNRDHPVPSYYELDLVTVVDWHQVDRRCYDALMQMLSDCSEAGIEYIFNSGYRTKKQQTLILETRTQEHMEDFDLSYDEAYEKALETVAIPGTSEHHLGLAVDLLGDEAIPWLTEHCWEYGFIVRYTEEKEAITGIIDEPWHFRYVGPAVSLDMQFSGLCLEEYLGAA